MIQETKQVIDEPIRVLAGFYDNRVRIYLFDWNGRNYKVSSMNLFHIERDGQKSLYHFAVSCQGNSYQISYDPFTLEWRLVDCVGG